MKNFFKVKCTAEQNSLHCFQFLASSLPGNSHRSSIITYILAFSNSIDQGYSTSFNEGPVGQVQYLPRSSPVELFICRKIVGFSAAKQMATFGFPKKKGYHLFGCRKSNYFAASHQFYLKKRSRTEFERPVFDQLLPILKLEVRL